MYRGNILYIYIYGIWGYGDMGFIYTVYKIRIDMMYCLDLTEFDLRQDGIKIIPRLAWLDFGWHLILAFRSLPKTASSPFDLFWIRLISCFLRFTNNYPVTIFLFLFVPLLTCYLELDYSSGSNKIQELQFWQGLNFV